MKAAQRCIAWRTEKPSYPPRAVTMVHVESIPARASIGTNRANASLLVQHLFVLLQCHAALFKLRAFCGAFIRIGFSVCCAPSLVLFPLIAFAQLFFDTRADVWASKVFAPMSPPLWRRYVFSGLDLVAFTAAPCESVLRCKISVKLFCGLDRFAQRASLLYRQQARLESAGGVLSFVLCALTRTAMRIESRGLTSGAMEFARWFGGLTGWTKLFGYSDFSQGVNLHNRFVFG